MLIEAAFQAVARDFERGPEDLLLLVSAAEGADRLLICAAHRAGIPYELVLPRTPLSFSGDFAGTGSMPEFEQVLNEAEAVIMPGDARFTKSRGYLRVSQFIPQRSDALIAVWDGARGNGPGGTAHTVESAGERGLPTYWVRTTPLRDLARLGDTNGTD